MTDPLPASRGDDALSACWTCESNSGKRRISPGRPILEGEYWLVEHAYPSALLGWLVIVLRRHAAALHELSAEEFHELARIQANLVALLYETLHPEKEYVACYAESEHFRHVHFHVVPVPADLPTNLRGARSFELLTPGGGSTVPAHEVRSLCDTLRGRLSTRHGA